MITDGYVSEWIPGDYSEERIKALIEEWVDGIHGGDSL